MKRRDFILSGISVVCAGMIGGSAGASTRRIRVIRQETNRTDRVFYKLGDDEFLMVPLLKMTEKEAVNNAELIYARTNNTVYIIKSTKGELYGIFSNSKNSKG